MIKSYLNSELEKKIGDAIHSARDREIVRLKLVDGWTYERIAERYGLSPRWVGEIVRRAKKILNG